VLAAVEDQQHPAIVEVVDDAGREVVRLHHQSQCRSGDFGDVVVRAAQSEVEKAHAVAESLGLLVRDGEGDGRLADAARSVDRDEAVGGQQLGYGAQIRVTAQHARRSSGQAGLASTRGDRGCRRLVSWVVPGHAADEAVASAGAVHDVGVAAAPAAERLAQAGDLNTQAAFLHGEAGPCFGDQLLLGHYAARVFHQQDQDIEGTAAEANELALHDQAPFGRKQTIGAKLSELYRGGHPCFFPGGIPLRVEATPFLGGLLV
jgi:hypothetical protein